MADEVDIYITVTRAQGSTWKPVRAVHQHDDVYEILGGATVPAGETWQFVPGDRVRCKPYELTDHDIVLVASEKVDPRA